MGNLLVDELRELNKANKILLEKIDLLNLKLDKIESNTKTMATK